MRPLLTNQKLALILVLLCEVLDDTLGLLYRGRQFDWQEMSPS
jgi:hypothetical protein